MWVGRRRRCRRRFSILEGLVWGWFGGGVVSGCWVYDSFMMPFLGCLCCVVCFCLLGLGGCVYWGRVCALALFRDKAARIGV
jgi:hypothetical protein